MCESESMTCTTPKSASGIPRRRIADILKTAHLQVQSASNSTRPGPLQFKLTNHEKPKPMRLQLKADFFFSPLRVILTPPFYADSGLYEAI